MKRTYNQHSRAWYSRNCALPSRAYDEIIIQTKTNDGKFLGEFLIEFYNLDGHTTCVRCFGDAMTSLAACSDLISAMAEKEVWTPATLIPLLQSLGFEDATPLRKGGSIESLKAKIEPVLIGRLERLQSIIEWKDVPAKTAAVGLFVKDREYFIVPVGLGCPDFPESYLIGAQLFGLSTLHQDDSEANLGDTASFLLKAGDEFFAALDGSLAPNLLEPSYSA